jgi:hypothetical protein
MPSPFPRLLRLIIRRAFEGKNEAFALAIDATPAQISHYLAGRNVPSLEMCLRIAQQAVAVGVTVSEVMRAANHEQAEALIRRLYGSTRPPPSSLLTPEERRHLLQWQQLDPSLREPFELLIRALNTRRRRRRPAS